MKLLIVCIFILYKHAHTFTQLKSWQKRAAQAPVNADIGDGDVRTTLTPPIPAPQPVRYRTLNITFRDIVLYRDNVIVVITGGNVKARYVNLK